MQIFTISEVSGYSYCHRNATVETEADAAKLIFIYGNL